MQLGNRLTRSLAALVLAVAGACLSPAPAVADDPPPMDPLLGPSTIPHVATADEWALIEAQILVIYPNADYATICYYALLWYNVLPPDYSTAPSNTAPPPPTTTTTTQPMTPLLPPLR